MKRFLNLNEISAIYIVVALSACGQTNSPAPTVYLAEAPDRPQKVMSEPLEETCNRLYIKNKRGKRVSWKGAIPIQFWFDPEFPADFVPHVESAMELWNAAGGVKLFHSNGYRQDKSLPSSEGLNTFYFADKRNPSLAAAAKSLYGNDGTIAVTDEWTSGNTIVKTNIVFNGIDHSFSTSHLHLDSFDIAVTALHELGHALGLDHNNDNPMSIMFFGESPFGISFRQVDSTSQQMLQCEYATSSSAN